MNIFEILSNLFGLNKNGQNNFDLSDIISLFSEGDNLSYIFSLIEKIRSGEIPIGTVLTQLAPVLLPLFLEQKNTQDDNQSSCVENSYGLSVIEDIASSDILSVISNYFEDTAS